MKATIYTKYGSPDVLRLEEVKKPTPGDNEVLLKIQAASVNALDWHLLRGKPLFIRLSLGILRPKNQILGNDKAGRIEAVGKNVKQFQPGDDVFGETRGGAFAEYACVSADELVIKPDNISYQEAAVVPVAAVTALQALRKGQIQSGQKVLINGASGGVGSFSVQIAKAFGAEVTAVCSSQNVDMVRSIGADHVIDYTKEDFTYNGRRYDLIHAANGDRSIFEYKRALSPNGNYVVSGGSMSQMFQGMLLGSLLSERSGKKMGFLSVKMNIQDLSFVAELLASGKVKPVIDRHYPLKEVAQAIAYLEEGHAKGKVVITMNDSGYS